MSPVEAVVSCIETWQELTDTKPRMVDIPLGWFKELRDELGFEQDGSLLFILGVLCVEADTPTPRVSA